MRDTLTGPHILNLVPNGRSPGYNRVSSASRKRHLLRLNMAVRRTPDLRCLFRRYLRAVASTSGPTKLCRLSAAEATAATMSTTVSTLLLAICVVSNLLSMSSCRYSDRQRRSKSTTHCRLSTYRKARKSFFCSFSAIANYTPIILYHVRLGRLNMWVKFCFEIKSDC